MTLTSGYYRQVGVVWDGGRLLRDNLAAPEPVPALGIIGVCQIADTEDNLRLGRALGQAIAEVDRKVVLIASGALSHTFWPLRELRKHEAAGVEHISSPPRRPPPTPSGWNGSVTATTRGSWRPCRSSTGSSPRPGSAIT